MKPLLILFFFIFFSVRARSQSTYQEVVYLKSGSIIRGIIIELIPNSSIKIQTVDSNLTFVYRFDEIEKITREIQTQKLVPAEEPIEKRDGFLGIGFGPSFPIGPFKSGDNTFPKAETGFQLNAITFGHLIIKNIGLAASWIRGSHSAPDQSENPWKYNCFLIGPLFSKPLSKHVDWDFKPLWGLCTSTSTKIGNRTYESSSLGLNMGTLFRFHLGNKWAFLFSADYFTTQAQFDDLDSKHNLSTFSMAWGLAYRLK